jgi:ABC-2 type transport system permease protein
MPFVFLLPFLLAFGLHSDSSPFFYLMIPIVLMPLFIISTSLGLIVATSISLFLPASRHKIARLLFCAIIVFFLYGLIKLFFAFISGAAYAPPLTHILRFFSIPSTLWLPSRWASTILGQLLNNTHQLIPLDELILLYSTSIWMSGICYMLFEIFFLRAYSNTQIEPGERKYRESYVSNLFSAIFFPLPPLVQQIALKEIKLIIRDIGYLFEVIMLFSLSMVYLANLRSYVALDHLSIIERSDWTLPVFMLNIAMNAFIITSLCVRFVFPTLSREGEAFWVLTTSPLERQKILTLKFQFWVVPIIIIGELFLTLSAYLLRIPLGLWIIYASAYCAICIAIVGGAVGLGTVHALQGECDSPQQVTGGIGSFLFMVLAIIVIIINIIPLKLMTEYIGYGIIDSQEMFFLMATLLLLIYFDCQVARWSLKQGRDKLIKQMM